MKINKKKIACFALASALVIPGAIGLAGCEKGHTHAFTSDPFYEVVTENGTKVARSWRECSCGAEDSHKKVDNAIIVNPTNMQDALDGKVVLRDGAYVIGEKEASETYESVNDKTFVFEAGEYNTSLEFRPTSLNATVYERASGTRHEQGDLVTGELDDSTIYIYQREFKT